MPLIPILAEMEFNGIGFKNEVIQKNKKVIEAKAKYEI
jgi:DNA polymerase I-like protein with 3'-5' exonuclease and polymerase domains